MTAAAAVQTVAATATDAAPLVAFLLVVSVTLLLCFLFGLDSEGTDDLYVAGRSLRPWRNAFALTGDAISVLTLLSTTGLVALAGYDGMAMAACTAGALGVLLVLARPVRNVGSFTLGDTLDARFRHRSIRWAAAVATLGVCLPMAVVQLTAAGYAAAALLGLSGTAAGQVCTVFIGSMMICAAALTGMRGNTMLQIAKTVTLFACMGLLVLAVLTRWEWSPDRLLADARAGSLDSERYFAPGMLFSSDAAGRFELVAAQLTIMLGAAVMPHMIMRVKAAEHGASARRSVFFAIAMTGVFCVMAVVLGLGSSAVGAEAPTSGFDPQSAAALLSLVNSLATEWGGDLLLAMTVSAVFLTSMTVVAALALSAGAAVVHDVWVQGVRGGAVAAGAEVKAMRWATPLVGVLAVTLAVVAQSWNIQFLTQAAVGASASAILPALVFALFWKKCTRAGIVWSVYAGFGSCLLLQFFGPAVSGTPGALFPAVDFAWYPFDTTGPVSIPVGFVAGWAASRLSSRGGRPESEDRYADVAARAVLDQENRQLVSRT
ncbi:sodium:solute symporter family transporter [Streptomyces cinereospinus]|uniref:Cation acetate symporter n=1 Tax=Streptomyces cinereospinus TaxID=285561 RepID=A0ABV5N886_9ACTN